MINCKSVSATNRDFRINVTLGLNCSKRPSFVYFLYCSYKKRLHWNTGDIVMNVMLGKLL